MKMVLQFPFSLCFSHSSRSSWWRAWSGGYFHFNCKEFFPLDACWFIGCFSTTTVHWGYATCTLNHGGWEHSGWIDWQDFFLQYGTNYNSEGLWWFAMLHPQHSRYVPDPSKEPIFPSNSHQHVQWTQVEPGSSVVVFLHSLQILSPLGFVCLQPWYHVLGFLVVVGVVQMATQTGNSVLLSEYRDNFHQLPRLIW